MATQDLNMVVEVVHMATLTKAEGVCDTTYRRKMNLGKALENFEKKAREFSEKGYTLEVLTETYNNVERIVEIHAQLNTPNRKERHTWLMWYIQ